MGRHREDRAMLLGGARGWDERQCTQGGRWEIPIRYEESFSLMLVKYWTRAQRGCGISIPGGIQSLNGQVPEQPALTDLLWAVVWTRDPQVPLLPHRNLWFRCGCRTVKHHCCTTALCLSNLSPRSKARTFSVHSAHSERTDVLMYHRNPLPHRKKTSRELKNFSRHWRFPVPAAMPSQHLEPVAANSSQQR